MAMQFQYAFGKKIGYQPVSRWYDYINPLWYIRGGTHPQRAQGMIEKFKDIVLTGEDTISDYESQETHINGFIADIEANKGIYYYKISETQKLELDSVIAEYVRYEYYSYDIATVSYTGIFISLLYKGDLIDIDLISSLINQGAEDAFQRIINTFTIEDK
jgi:hypothetical protein